MSESSWLPGLLVLVAGLITGLFLAFRLRQGEPKISNRQQEPDIQLRIKDLKARRDDLYRRIRSAEEDNLTPAEKDSLEEAAALILRELDLAVGGLATPAEPVPEHAEPSVEETAPAAHPTRNPLLKGLAYGSGLVLIVALLVYWAVRDAQPKPQDGMSQMPVGSAEAPHEGQSPLPPELAPRVANLRARLAADPEDWAAHRELAVTLVAGGQFLEAFEEATRVLQQFPNDPDGLLVHGVVRLTMGQADQAVRLLDRVLAEQPDQRQALIYRGLALYQLGNIEQAMDTWEMGLQMAGGSDPEFEELLTMAQSGQGPPTAMGAAGPQDDQRVARPLSSEPAAATPDGFSVQIELAAGAQPAPQAVLFVFLRPAGGGPPVAATRISSPTFPTGIVLDASHSMMGAELPEQGILVARLDTDGNVTTSDPTDLVIETAASMGQVTRVTLGQ